MPEGHIVLNKVVVRFCFTVNIYLQHVYEMGIQSLKARNEAIKLDLTCFM